MSPILRMRDQRLRPTALNIVHHLRSDPLQRNRNLLQTLHPLLLPPNLPASLVPLPSHRHWRLGSCNKHHLYVHFNLPMHAHRLSMGPLTSSKGQMHQLQHRNTCWRSHQRRS